MGTWSWAFWIGSILVAAVGLWALWRALFSDRARGRRRCGKCWYDMAGVPGLKCPECGREAKREKQLGRTRRRWGRAVFACVLLSAAGGLAVTPRIVESGWDAVPLWAVCGVASVYDTTNHALADVVADRVIARNRGVAYSKTDRVIMARYAIVLLGEKTPFTVTTNSPTLWGAMDSVLLGSSLLRDAGAECRHVEADLIRLMLHAPDPGVQQAAAEALSALEAPREETRTAFVDVIRSGGTPEITWIALNVLQRSRPPAEIMVPALIAALDRAAEVSPVNSQPNPWPFARMPIVPQRPHEPGVLEALAWYGKDAAAAAPAVRRAVARDGSLFMSALGVLSTFGPVGAEDVCQILKTLGEDDLRMAMQVIGAQGVKTIANEDCVRELMITHMNDSSAVWSAWTLGRMQWKDVASRDALRMMIDQSANAQTRMNALDAVMYAGGMSEEDGRDVLRSTVKDRDPNVRVLALSLMRYRMQSFEGLRAEVEAALQDEDARAREIAAKILGR